MERFSFLNEKVVFIFLIPGLLNRSHPAGEAWAFTVPGARGHVLGAEEGQGVPRTASEYQEWRLISECVLGKSPLPGAPKTLPYGSNILGVLDAFLSVTQRYEIIHPWFISR